MCDYCKDGAFETIIENEYKQYTFNVFGNRVMLDKPFINDMSVVFEMRCGSGYIRSGDRHEMQCIDHSKNFKINYCPICGRKLGVDND